MRISNMVAAVALVGAIGTAQASVIYNWQPLSTSGVIVSSGQLVFSDQAYSSGSTNFDQTSNYYDPLTTNIYPNSPIIRSSLSFTITAPAGANIPVKSVTINPREGRSDNSQIYYLSGDFLFADDLLTGGFSAHDIESNYTMQSNADGLWSLGHVNSDAFVGADQCSERENNYDCGTATGRWVMDASNMADVPEPNGLALFALGVLGLIGWTFGRNRRASA